MLVIRANISAEQYDLNLKIVGSKLSEGITGRLQVIQIYSELGLFG